MPRRSPSGEEPIQKLNVIAWNDKSEFCAGHTATIVTLYVGYCRCAVGDQGTQTMEQPADGEKTFL